MANLLFLVSNVLGYVRLTSSKKIDCWQTALQNLPINSCHSNGLPSYLDSFHSGSGSFLFYVNEKQQLSLERISIAMAGWNNLRQDAIRTMRPDSKSAADERMSKECPTQLVTARVLARVVEWNSKLLQRYCWGTLPVLQRPQVLLTQLRAIAHSKPKGCKLRGVGVAAAGNYDARFEQ